MSEFLDDLSNAVTVVFWITAMVLYARGWRIEVQRPRAPGASVAQRARTQEAPPA